MINKLSEPYVARPGSDDHYGYGLVVGDYRGVDGISEYLCSGSRALKRQPPAAEVAKPD